MSIIKPSPKIIVHEKILPQHMEHGYAEMFRRVFGESPRNEAWSLEESLEFIQSHYGHDSVFVTATVGDTLAGLCFGCRSSKSHNADSIGRHVGNLDSFYLSTIMLDRDYRGVGTARAMLEKTEASIRKNFKLVVARTRVDAIVISAIFGACGYSKSDVFTADMGGAVADRVFHIKVIR